MGVEFHNSSTVRATAVPFLSVSDRQSCAYCSATTSRTNSQTGAPVGFTRRQQIFHVAISQPTCADFRSLARALHDAAHIKTLQDMSTPPKKHAQALYQTTHTHTTKKRSKTRQLPSKKQSYGVSAPRSNTEQKNAPRHTSPSSPIHAF